MRLKGKLCRIVGIFAFPVSANRTPLSSVLCEMAEKTLRQKFSMKTVLEYILKGWLPDIVGWCTKEGSTKGGGIVNISIIINRNILPMVGGIQSQKITFLVLQLYE